MYSQLHLPNFISKYAIRFGLNLKNVFLFLFFLFGLIGWFLVLKKSLYPSYQPCIPYPYKDAHLHKLAIVVPYRDRKEHLEVFTTVMDSFFRLVKQPYEIIIVEQADKRSFNRGKLMNIGFSLEKENFDYFCFHDVDTVPAEMCLDYSFPTSGARHLAKNIQKNKWRKEWWYTGGITCIKNDDYIKVNGFSNNFWGWGGEDDEFAKRLSIFNIPMQIPNHAYFFSLERGHESQDKTYYEHNLAVLNITEHDSVTISKDGLSNLIYTLQDTIQEKLYKIHYVQLLPDDNQDYFKN